MVGKNGVISQIKRLDKTGKDVSQTLSQIEEDLFSLEEKLATSERNIEHIDEITEEADVKLEEIKFIFEFDGKKSLEEATKRAKIAGEHSEKMTKLAHKARDLTSDIEVRANNIIEKASEVKNKSIDAYTEVKEVNFQQAELVETIKLFKEDLTFLEKKINNSIKWTSDVKQRAEETKNNATVSLNEVNNIEVPDINIPELIKKNEEIKEEAGRLPQQSQELIENSSSLRQMMDKDNEERQTLLKEAKNNQEDIIDVKNDLVFANEQANAAIKLWDEIYDGAVSNFKLLKGKTNITFFFCI